LDDLLDNLQEDTQNQDDGEQISTKEGKVIKFGWIDGVLVKLISNFAFFHFDGKDVVFVFS